VSGGDIDRYQFSVSSKGSTKVKVSLRPDALRIRSEQTNGDNFDKEAGISHKFVRDRNDRDFVDRVNDFGELNIYERSKREVKYKYLTIFGWNIFKIFRKKL
jgi:hypothetical protein